MSQYDDIAIPEGVKNVRADNDFLIALIGKLTEIMENTADMDTANELSEFIDVIADSLR